MVDIKYSKPLKKEYKLNDTKINTFHVNLHTPCSPYIVFKD